MTKVGMRASLDDMFSGYWIFSPDAAFIVSDSCDKTAARFLKNRIPKQSPHCCTIVREEDQQLNRMPAQTPDVLKITQVKLSTFLIAILKQLIYSEKKWKLKIFRFYWMHESAMSTLCRAKILYRKNRLHLVLYFFIWILFLVWITQVNSLI